MTLLAHAIATATGSTGVSAPPAGGLGGRPLRWIAAADLVDLGLWATGWDGPPGALGRDDALAHHSIVAAIAAAAPCLPVRFGTWLTDDAAAAALLAERQVSLRAALARIAGRSEIAVTLLWRESAVVPGRAHAAPAAPSVTSSASGPATPGRMFLEGRRADLVAAEGRQERAEALATGLIVGLAADRADVRQETCPTAEVALSLSILVPTVAADAAKATASRLVGGLDGVRGVVSGPWPPYSFTAELD